MSSLKNNVLSLFLLLGLVGISLYYYRDLPQTIPTKFDLSGNPTQYSSKEFLVGLMPAVHLVLILVINLLVRASPAKFSMPNSRQPIDVILFGCGLLFLGIHLGILADPGKMETFVPLFS